MTPRQIRVMREAHRFMPRLWTFAYPMDGRGLGRARRVALRLWFLAFQLKVRTGDI